MKDRKRKENPGNHRPQEAIQMVEDNTPSDKGTMQPEVDIGKDKSIFTRLTHLFKPEWVTEILRLVNIGLDLSNTEQAKVMKLILEFADCFALSVREVTLIPGAEHRINIPPDTVFLKKIPHQKPLTDNQCIYFNDTIDILIAADIIETICPEDIKCCSPITLAQKAHERPGLSLNEIQHRVSEECIVHGMTPAHNIDAKDPTSANSTPTKHNPAKPQTWRICQNYSALNRVTQVFPTPGGDIHTKQCKVSGHH